MLCAFSACGCLRVTARDEPTQDQAAAFYAGPGSLVPGVGAPATPEAYVSFDVPPDADCGVDPDSQLFLSKGTYDISPGLAPDGGDACANSYFVYLRVEGAPSTVRFDEAAVALETVDGDVLDFGATLPNPFTTVVAATLESASSGDTTVLIAAFEAIPVEYASWLGDLAGATIIARIELRGTTADGVDVATRAFRFPIEICEGCLTMCLYDDILNRMLTVDDVTGDACDDTSLSGQDSRICIDPGC